MMSDDITVWWTYFRLKMQFFITMESYLLKRVYIGDIMVFNLKIDKGLESLPQNQYSNVYIFVTRECKPLTYIWIRKSEFVTIPQAIL